uniref:Protein kinase domain-containing protein n=1 Tax=Bionectria ochroleuca TaxID=29856 RepID=A0A0B7KEL8_BIOOC
MVVHDDAHAHLPRRAKVPRLVLLKTYEEIYHDEYRLEREANNVFASKEIAPCKGSFHWFDEKNGRIGTLIFEYAEHGTLLDLYLQSHPPYLPEDIKAFWEGITGPAKGLHTIHKQVGYQDGLHHDMKPSNILVFSKEYIDSKLVYDFKIGDFGASYLIPTNVTLEAINRGTTRTYAPPEIYLGDSVKYIVGPTLDMWSIGCIIIEAAVWLTFNERGRQDFRNKRIEEISKLPDLRNLGYGDCFHDGSVALKCVTEYVNLMKLHGRPSDKITPEIVNLATENLLVEEDSRINSLNLHSRLRAILNDKRSSEKLDPTHSLEAYQTKSPSIVGSGMPQQILTGQPLRSEPGEMAPFEMSGDEKISKVSTPGPSSTQPVGPGKLIESNPSSADEAEVYIDQLSSWIKSKKTQWHNDELPGWKLAQGQLKGRDFVSLEPFQHSTYQVEEQNDTNWRTKIILIDNSKSMQKYREEVLRWVSELGYLVKELDPDGGEIRCTSDHTKVVKFKRSTDAKRFVSEKFADGKGAPCNMENALLGVVDSIREPQSTVSSRLSFITRSGSGPKKTTVLVFTDGVWDSSLKNGLIGVDKSIESLIKHMKDSGIGRPNISIQFLRFGSEPVGIKRLEFLDDKLGEKHEFDIVDHKPVTACIWKILNGAVFRGTD